MIITRIYVDGNGLRHIAPVSNKATYCGKPVAAMNLIDKAVPVGICCRRCIAGMRDAQLEDDNQSEQRRKEWLAALERERSESDEYAHPGEYD